MGIVNLTPDSFYEQSRATQTSTIIKQVEGMLKDGASIIDLGAQSTRPGAEFIVDTDEAERLLQSFKALRKEFPNTLFSIDTFHSMVADQALSEGADIINDVSGGSMDQNMMTVVAKHHAPFVMMHMKGTPQNMINQNDYQHLMADIIAYFSRKLKEAKESGIVDLIIDPGFGFAKNIQQNFELLAGLELLQALNKPVLVGLSRKSMIYKTLQITPQESLNGTTVLQTVAILKGASILRVHDVKEAVETIRLLECMQ
jgi:dihydropteroate synthase